MIGLENFRMQWANTMRVSHGYTRVKIMPLECYIGYDDALCRSLIIISRYKVNNLVSSKTVSIQQARKDKHCFQLEINLFAENLEDVFVRMCYDLLKQTEGMDDEKKALKNFEKRYKQWQNLFENGKSGILTDQEQQGLIGELLFLRSQIIEMHRPIYEAVSGWFGPLNEHQDFSYSEKWYEIKTVKDQAEKIQISSLEQLSRLDFGELVIYRLVKISGQSNGWDLNKFTLNILVENLSQYIQEDDRALQKFQALLSQAGYLALPEYDNQFYKLIEKMNFVVDDKFPRLTKDKIPSAILSASYSLSISKIKTLRG